MADPAILMPEVDDVRAGVHIIPPEGTEVTIDPRSHPQFLGQKKRLRPSDSEVGTGKTYAHQALDSLHSLGSVAHALTASLVKREALDLNRALLDIQQFSAKRQRQEGQLETTKPELPASSDSAAPLGTSFLRPKRKESPDADIKETGGDFNATMKPEGPDVNALWRRVNRNRRMAVMLREFEVLQQLMIAEITDMVTEG
jgi:hypothetical protein